MRQQEAIVDIAAGMSSMVALSETQQVYVWGERMGIYPSGLELSVACVEKKGRCVRARAAQAAGWPRQAGVWGGLTRDLELRAASGASWPRAAPGLAFDVVAHIMFCASTLLPLMKP